MTKSDVPLASAPAAVPDSTDETMVAAQIEEASLALLEMTLAALAAQPSLSTLQMRALLTLDRQGTQNVNGLAARMELTISAASRLVARLEDSGLAERSMAPHSRRETLVSLTDEGRHAVAVLRADRRRHIEAVLTRLSPLAARQLAKRLAQFDSAWTKARTTDEVAG